MIVTPGQDTALTIRNTLLGGSRAGRRTAAGVAAGQTLWALAASLGLAALLAASEPVFLALRLAGAAYLVWLGLQALWAAVRGRDGRRSAPRPRAAARRFARACCRTSATRRWPSSSRACCRSSAARASPRCSALGLLFSCLTLTWLSLYAVLVARAGDTLRRGPVRRALDALTGSVLVALGVKVAAR